MEQMPKGRVQSDAKTDVYEFVEIYIIEKANVTKTL